MYIIYMKTVRILRNRMFLLTISQVNWKLSKTPFTV